MLIRSFLFSVAVKDDESLNKFSCAEYFGFDRDKNGSRDDLNGCGGNNSTFITKKYYLFLYSHQITGIVLININQPVHEPDSNRWKFLV